MKKFIALLLSIMILFGILSVFVYAEVKYSPEQVGYFSGNYCPIIEHEGNSGQWERKNMLDNPYYEINYDVLLNISESVYLKYKDQIDSDEYIEYAVDNYLNAEENYVTLILDSENIPWDEEDMFDISEYIRTVLDGCFDEDDILFVGDTALAAVVRVTQENKNVLKEIDSLVFVGDAFFSDMNGTTLAVTGEYTLGNVTGEEKQVYYDDPSLNVPLKKVSAADARIVLRYSAGIEEVNNWNKRFYYCADMNFDGEINSTDARLILRTSAGLETEYVIVFGYATGWSDIWEE